MKNCRFYLSNVSFLFALVGCNTEVEQNIHYPNGGYDYPGTISPGDSNYYLYPIKNLIPRQDSFLFVDAHYLFQSFQEPNLSIKPSGEDIFRLTREGGLIWPTVITITNKEIVVKQATSGSPYPERDENQLDSLERFHYYILERYFPLDEGRYKAYNLDYIDSMIKLYPKLLDPKYYSYLREKAIVKSKQFVYTTKRINITGEKFKSIVDEIDSSRYWSLPFRNECETPPDDGFGYMLEANTKSKYNVAIYSLCPPDTSAFMKVCTELMKYADEK